MLDKMGTNVYFIKMPKIANPPCAHSLVVGPLDHLKPKKTQSGPLVDNSRSQPSTLYIYIYIYIYIYPLFQSLKILIPNSRASSLLSLLDDRIFRRIPWRSEIR
ncbi:hypothetical protein ACP275_12G052900 [Erythranthe tilingii]